MAEHYTEIEHRQIQGIKKKIKNVKNEKKNANNKEKNINRIKIYILYEKGWCYREKSVF